jgi:hypothetical protein
MAIDTLNKKLSLFSYQQVYIAAIPKSTDGLDQADNQQLLWGYPGILWEAPSTSPFQAESVRGFSIQTVYVNGVSKQSITINGSSKL